MPLKFVISPFLMLVLVLAGAFPAAAGTPWKSVRTKYLNLMYQDDADLKAFDKKIEPVEKLGGLSSFSAGSSPQGPHRKLIRKMDELVEKVQLILDMRKPIRINVRIYPNKKALSQVYFEIYKKKKELRAWYIFEHNTVYLQVDDLFAGMLAHEIAHAIVDHFLDARPPRATSEILARYVDAHLNKEAKVY